MKHSIGKANGSILLWTVILITVLSTIAATMLRVVTTKYQNATQTGIWQESLLAAESGIDLAILELRKQLYPSPIRDDAWNASRGWNGPPVNGATSGLKTQPNAGLAGTTMTIETYVDAPPALIDGRGQYLSLIHI